MNTNANKKVSRQRNPNLSRGLRKKQKPLQARRGYAYLTTKPALRWDSNSRPCAWTAVETVYLATPRRK